MNDKGVFRTAPATQDPFKLKNTGRKIFLNKTKTIKRKKDYNIYYFGPDPKEAGLQEAFQFWSLK